MILSKRLLHCRLEWRPSSLLQCMLFALMLLAILSLGISALSRSFLVPASLLIVYGTSFQIRNLRQNPRCSLFWRAGDDSIDLNFGHFNESLIQPRCHRQGPLWIISAMDTRRKQRDFIFLPDTINITERRLLRLVAATPQKLD